jgi:FtsZ-binding cell division protein ZapB
MGELPLDTVETASGLVTSPARQLPTNPRTAPPALRCPMNRNKHIILILILVSVGVWGCARQTGNSPGMARLRDLESRNAKLEDDYRALLAQRDQLRKSAEALEQKCSQLTSDLELFRTVTQERDELRKQVALLTNEKNNVQTTLTQFTKELQQLIGRMESTAAGNPTGQVLPATSMAVPATAAPVLLSPGKS